MIHLVKYLYYYITWKFINVLTFSPFSPNYGCYPVSKDPSPTYCTKCGHVFRLKEVEVEYLPVEYNDQVEASWFCPKCGADEHYLETSV